MPSCLKITNIKGLFIKAKHQHYLVNVVSYGPVTQWKAGEEKALTNQIVYGAGKENCTSIHFDKIKKLVHNIDNFNRKLRYKRPDINGWILPKCTDIYNKIIFFNFNFELNNNTYFKERKATQYVFQI